MPPTKKTNLTDQIKRTAKKKIVEKDFKAKFSYGNTLLNLVCADNPDAGGAPGTFVNIVGDKSTGKTFLALTLLAEAAGNPEFKDYALIHDNVEAINFFDMDYLFGPHSDRIQEPENGHHSDTIQDFQANLYEALSNGPCIYILDSFDALTDEDELEKYEKRMEGGKVSGSYGMGKAKASSELFRNMYSKIEETGSWLIIVSQVRENINSFSFEKYRRNGGKALDFYACNVIWLTHTKPIKKTVRKIERSIGAKITATCKKNKITGKSRACDFTIYYDYGIDCIGSCIDFLVKAGVITKSQKSLKAPDFDDFSGTQDKLIRYIEDNDLEEDLFQLTGETWNEIEDSLKLNRKKKYE